MDEGEQKFCCLGINYRTSPVATREQFAIPQRLLSETMRCLCRAPRINACVLLSTCNRTEVYFESQYPGDAAEIILDLIAGEEKEIFRSCFYLYTGEEALRHLALVAAGLDSMVIGETEIFGQLKAAYCAARACGAATGSLNRIFQRSFSIAKKVRSCVPLTVGPTSVGAAAVYLAQQVFGDLSGSSVLIVGAGDVARSTAQSLVSRGARSIFVANRSYNRAVDLAERVGGSVIRFSEWIPYLECIDIVIVSTAAPVYVVSNSVVQQACAARQGRTLFLIDLSVPRNVDPSVSSIKGAVLYDIDTMQNIAEKTLQSRKNVVRQGEALVNEWIAEEGERLIHQCPMSLRVQISGQRDIFFPAFQRESPFKEKKHDFFNAD